MNQKEQLEGMFKRLEGKSEDEQRAAVKAFSPEEQELLKAYHKFRQEQSGDGAPGGGGAPPGGGGQPGQPNVMGGAPPGDGFPKNPTPQEQQKILKDIFASMEGKDRNEQNEIINKFKPIQKEIFDKYNDYQFEMNKEHMKKQKKEAGHCEDKDVYKADEFGDYDYSSPELGTCTQFSLWDDDLGDDGAKALAEALRDNLHLVVLSLENTGIEAEGVQALAGALSGNKVMKSLDLEGNSMGNAGAKALASVLHTTEIEILGIAHNEVGDSGFASLMELVENNRQFVHVLSNGNRVSKKRQKKFEKLVAANAEAAAAKAAAEQAVNAAAESNDDDEDLEEALELEIENEKDEL